MTLYIKKQRYIFDEMVSRDAGEYRYPLGGKLYVFNKNDNIGFIKGHMCSPAIATQAEAYNQN